MKRETRETDKGPIVLLSPETPEDLKALERMAQDGQLDDSASFGDTGEVLTARG